jgi:putative acetyltransferase
VDLSQLAVESVIVLLIRDAQQQAVGCGAIVLGHDGVGR